uniref:dolichyl-phosphate-mannose--protein mannosyltransferase n=1 Tax=Ciona savignyi TaxID=51511 RepID=H2Z0G0_CIOSA
FILYLNSCSCGFVFDDVSAILKNKDVLTNTSISNLFRNDFWGTPMSEEQSHKSYRPLTVLTFRVNYIISGFNPWSYHLFNAMLHSIVSYLVFKMNNRILEMCCEGGERIHKNQPRNIKTEERKWNSNVIENRVLISFVSGLLFAVHPVHTEAVSGVVGRAELLSAFVFYSCHFIMSFIFTIFGSLSKEQSVTVLAVLIILDVVVINKVVPILYFVIKLHGLDDFCLILMTSSRKQIKFKSLCLRIIACIVMGMSLIYVRILIMHGSIPHFTAFDNPASVESFPARHLTYNYLLPLNAFLLLNPSNLLCDWTMGTVPIVSSIFDVRNMATLVFWMIFLAIGCYSILGHSDRSRVSAFAMSIMTFAFLPAANIVLPVGFVVAERVLYIPSIGFSLLVSIGLHRLLHKRLVWFLFAILIASHCGKTVYRNYQWRNEREIFRSGLKVTTQNAKIWNNIGHSYEGEKDWKTAMLYFKQATTVQPNDIGAHMNLARVLEELNQTTAAESSYRAAKSFLPKPVKGKPYTARIAPNHLQLFVRLAQLIKNDESRLFEAEQLYREAILMRPSFYDAHLNRGDILLRMNKPKSAIASYERALNLTENKADVYFNLGVIYDQMNEKGKALEAYTYSIQSDPLHVKALYNSAVILQATRDENLLHRAKSRIERILKIDSNHLLAKTVMGSIYMDLGDNFKAISWWKDVLQVILVFTFSLFNIALLYSKMDNSMEDCIEATHELLSHHPHHVKGWLLYGDVMLNKKGNITEAQRAYRNVIEVDPDNIQGQHNYCVTLVQEKKLVEAESCLREVLVQYPHESFV